MPRAGRVSSGAPRLGLTTVRPLALASRSRRRLRGREDWLPGPLAQDQRAGMSFEPAPQLKSLLIAWPRPSCITSLAGACPGPPPPPRRYNVSTAQIDAAIGELVSRHLIRRLPDGQLYRVSPVEYLIPLEGVPGLGPRIDPMGGDLTCRSRQSSWRRVPEDIGRVLHIDSAEPVCVVRAVWATRVEPAAHATTYLPAEMAGPFMGGPPPSAAEA